MGVSIFPTNCPDVKNRISCCYCTEALNPECPECCGQGFFEITDKLFELHLSQRNWNLLIQMLNPPFTMESCGSIEGEQIVELRRAVMHARNSGKKRSEAVRPTTQMGGFIDCGQSAERVNDHLETLDAVLRWAQENNERVTWG